MTSSLRLCENSLLYSMHNVMLYHFTLYYIILHYTTDRMRLCKISLPYSLRDETVTSLP
jgi:hypothetical protein